MGNGITHYTSKVSLIPIPLGFRILSQINFQGFPWVCKRTGKRFLSSIEKFPGLKEDFKK